MKPRYIIIVAIILLLMAAAGIYVYFSQIDTSLIKTTISDRLENGIGKKVKIAGDLQLKFRVPLTISLQDIQIQNASWGSAPEMFQIQQLDVKVALFPLLFGNLSIHELRLKGAELLLETSESGQWNFDPRKDDSVSEPPVVDKIRIDKSRLDYRNGESGKRYRIDIANLTANIGKRGEQMSFDIRGAYKKLPFSLNGSLQPADVLLNSNKPMTIRLKAASGQNSVDGQIAVEMSKDPPVLKADLSSNYLDLRDFISDKHSVGKKSDDESSDNRIFSSQPLSFNFLSNAEANIQFEAKKLLLPYLAMNDVNIKLNLKDGRMSLNPIEADFEDGKLSGEFVMSANKQIPAMDAKMRIENLNLEPMFDALEITNALSGTVGVDSNLHGHGKSPADIMGSLNGKITTVMQEGQIAAKYLKNAEKLNMDVADNFLKLFAFAGKKKEFAEINCLVCVFKLKDGIADSKVLVFDTERVGVVGDGKINLKTERLNISLKPIEKGGLGTDEVNVGLGEIADLFKLGGTLSHPVITIDKSETAISTVITLGKAIGGTLLFGPAGLAAALVDLDFSDNDPCISALKQAAAEEKNK
jgi:uncharacterized protein involved in outer membrane biogenesis